MENLPAFLLVVQVFFAGHPPQTHQVPMPDQKVCLQEAEEFLDKFEPPEGSLGIAAGCVKKLVKEEKS